MIRCAPISPKETASTTRRAAAFLDVALRFFNSADDTVKIHQAMIEQYRKHCGGSGRAFQIIDPSTPLEGFADGAFLLEVSADPASDYKSAQIIFYKGKIGGSISAWKKPDSSLETTKTVLSHILSNCHRSSPLIAKLALP